jgi:hypothetical protein
MEIKYLKNKRMLNPNKDERPTSRDYLKSLVSFKKLTNSTKYLNCIFFHFKVSIGKTDETSHSMTDSGLGSSITDSLSRSLSMTYSESGSTFTDSSSSRFDSLPYEFEHIKNQKNAKLDEFSSEKLKLEIYSFGKSSQSENNLKMLISKFF